MERCLFEIRKGADTPANKGAIERYLHHYFSTGDNIHGIGNTGYMFCFKPITYSKNELRLLTNQVNNHSKNLYIAKIYKNGDILYYKAI